MKAHIRITSCLLTAVMAIGSASGVAASTLTAGLTSYTESVASSASLPTAGFASAMLQVAIDSEAEAQIASNSLGVTENDVETVSAASEYANIAIANVENFVYIRSEANAESDYVGKLYTKNAADVLEVLDGWYKIQSGDVTGYVSSDYMIYGDEQAVKDASRRVALVNTSTLNVRSEANADSELLGQVDEGDDLTVTDESIEGWVKVSIEEGEGYISTDYVTLYTEYTYAESKEAEEARLAKEKAEREAAQAAAEAAKKAEKKSSSSSSSSSSSGEGKHYSAPSGSDGSSVADYAVQFVGNPYVYGGTSLTNGADCSGFVMSVYAAFGVSLPHSSSSLRSSGYAVEGGLSNAQPGDIICYSGHVAIYIGGGQIVHASNRKSGIKISNADYTSILAVRRIF